LLVAPHSSPSRIVARLGTPRSLPCGGLRTARKYWKGRVMGEMHAARLESSKRLRDLERFLRARGDAGATSIEIGHSLRCAAASTDVSELRRALRGKGETVLSKPEGRNANGRKVWRYKIAKIGAAYEVAGEGAGTGASPTPGGEVPAPAAPEPDPDRMEQGDLFGRAG
jgi:hypothetical protein